MKSSTTLLSKLFLSLFVTVSLISCRTSIDFGEEKGNGNITTEKRNLTENFEKIRVSSGIEVIVSQADVISIEVETDENIQPIILTKVENGTLIITADESFDTKQNPKVRVNLPIISGLKSSSGSSIQSRSNLKSTSLIVDSSSGSSIEIEVETDYISLESSSGSSISVKGKALKAETASSSGSTINAGNLMANDVFSQTSSGSSTQVYPIISLNGKASSGSKITYMNVPKNLQKEESSGGSITKD